MTRTASVFPPERSAITCPSWRDSGYRSPNISACAAARAGKITALAEAMARDDAGAVEDLRAGLSFAQAMAKYKDI